MKRTVSLLLLSLSTFVLNAHLGKNLNNNSASPLHTHPSSGVPASFKGAMHSEHSRGIGFEKNKGQWPDVVQFKADIGNGRRIYFENNKFTYVVYNPDDVYRSHEAERDRKKSEDRFIAAHAFEMEFLHANPQPVLEGGKKSAFHYNYFLGNDPSRWASEVPVYKTLLYRDLYPGVDLRAYENGSLFKYDYILKPGVQAGIIQLKFNGTTGLELSGKNLHIHTSAGDVIESIPYAFQLVDGREVQVACEYLMGKDGKTVSFHFPDGYDTRYELIIDPVVMASTYSGSTQNTYGHCATYDASGNIYSGGRCFGVGYPVSTGALQVTFGGNVDISVSKLDPTGSNLLYATYMGGSSGDYPHSMFVNAANELYIYGTTSSTDFPTTTGAYDVTHNGASDMILCRFNPTGTTLLGSTYIGGSGSDGLNSASSYNYGDEYRGELVINSAGDLFVVATTNSSNFPTTPGAYDQTANGLQDAVVLKMNSTLSTLQWATYLGGTGSDAGFGIRLNSTGDIYVVGLTSGSFPIVTGAQTGVFQGGAYDAFVSRLDANGANLINSTYLGTGGIDIGYFVDIDFNNDIYIYGISEGTFPIAGQVYLNGNSENFLTKLNPALSNISFLTVLGNGTKNLFSPSALMVDLCRNIYLAGWGSNSNYPITPNATQSVTTGSSFHIMVLSQNAGSLLYGSYYGNGGDHVDGGTSRFDPNGVVYQAVCACGQGFPTLNTAFSPSNAASGCDIAVFKIDFQVNCNPLLTNTTICLGDTAIISVSNVNSLINPTFSIQPGGMVSNTPSFTVSPLATTVYTVFITGVNGFSTVVTNTGLSTVSIAPVPQAIPSLTQAACSSTFNAFDIGLTFNPTGTIPSYTVVWAPIPNGITTPTQTGASGGIAPGVYNASVIAAFGCSTSTSFTMNPAPTTVSFNLTGPFVITCANPTAVVSAAPSTYSYNWSGLTGIYTGPSASFTLGQSGTWTVTGTDTSSGCSGTNTFVISENISTSTSTITPLMQNITCSVSSVITVTAQGSPSVNMSHFWISPNGGTLTTNTDPSFFVPGLPGIYTHVLVNDVNGCSVTKTFTVTSNSGFPTYSVSSPQNFTLGCTTKSVATINIVGAQTDPPGGAVSYTLLGPGSSTNYATGSAATYTVASPGTWTVITKDNTSFCESKVQVSVLQNTFSPALAVNVPATQLNCYTPSVVLVGSSSTPNTSFIWSFPGTPGNLQSNTIAVVANSVQTTNTLIANYTLTVTDDNNTCKSATVIPMLQNLFPPNAGISGGGTITCVTPTVILTNQSSSSIPPVFGVPNLPVIGYTWNGPTPQVESQLATTYVGAMPGTYTMVARDLNNGCFAVATRTVEDFRVYPQVIRSESPSIIDCGAASQPIFPNVVGNTSALTYSWISAPGATVSSISSKSLSVTRAGQYNVIITNTLNGCVSSAFIEVISGTLQARIAAEPVSGYAPLSVSFTNTSFSADSATATDNITSYWNFGNNIGVVDYTAAVLPSVIFEQAGTYPVYLFAQKGTCLDSATVFISVEIPSELEIPNIFTPNGDGSNDLFFVKATNLDQIDIRIIDRWGNIVYQVVSETGNIEWDGKHPNGKDAAEGVYLYTLKASGKDGATYNKTGSITLVR